MMTIFHPPTHCRYPPRTPLPPDVAGILPPPHVQRYSQVERRPRLQPGAPLPTDEISNRLEGAATEGQPRTLIWGT